MKLNEIRDNDGAVQGRATASAAASAPERARRAAAAARARRRARAAATRVSRAARCRCIGVCRSAASTSRTRSNTTRSTSAASSRRSRPASSIRARRSRSTSLVAAGVCSKPRDGVRMLGEGELKAKARLRDRGRVQVGGRGDREGRRIGEDPGEPLPKRERPSHIVADQAAARELSRGAPAPRDGRRRAQIEIPTMASAAEQLAANINFGAIAKAEELKKRIWFTLGALIVYRLGTYIPLPGIDPEALRQAFSTRRAACSVCSTCSRAARSSAWRSSRSTSCPTSRPRSSSSS